MKTFYKMHVHKLGFLKTPTHLTWSIKTVLTAETIIAIHMDSSAVNLKRILRRTDAKLSMSPLCCTICHYRSRHTGCKSHFSRWKGRCRDSRCLVLTLSHRNQEILLQENHHDMLSRLWKYIYINYWVLDLPETITLLSNVAATSLPLGDGRTPPKTHSEAPWVSSSVLSRMCSLPSNPPVTTKT